MKTYEVTVNTTAPRASHGGPGTAEKAGAPAAGEDRDYVLQLAAKYEVDAWNAYQSKYIQGGCPWDVCQTAEGHGERRHSKGINNVHVIAFRKTYENS